MSKNRITDLERRIRWFFKYCAPEIDVEWFELILDAEWNDMKDKLVLDPIKLKKVFSDIAGPWPKKKNSNGN